VIGKTIRLDGAAYNVAGIMPAGFTFPFDAEVWTPLEIRVDPHNSFSRPVIGRLKPGGSQERAQSALAAFVGGLPPDPRERRKDFVARIVPLKEMLVGNIRPSLMVSPARWRLCC